MSATGLLKGQQKRGTQVLGTTQSSQAQSKLSLQPEHPETLMRDALQTSRILSLLHDAGADYLETAPETEVAPEQVGSEKVHPSPPSQCQHAHLYASLGLCASACRREFQKLDIHCHPMKLGRLEPPPRPRQYVKQLPKTFTKNPNGCCFGYFRVQVGTCSLRTKWTLHLGPYTISYHHPNKVYGPYILLRAICSLWFGLESRAPPPNCHLLRNSSLFLLYISTRNQ